MSPEARGAWRDRVDAFLFDPLDARVAAWMRMGFGLAVPYFFFSLGRAPAEWIPPDKLRLYEELFLTPGYFLLTAVLGAALALGVRPRPVAALLFVLLQPLAALPGSMQSRQILLFSLLAFAFVRSNARRWPGSAPSSAEGRDAGPVWPLRLIQIQLSVLYGINAIAKCHPAYLNGDVLGAMSVALDNFVVDLSSGYLTLGPLSVPVAICAVSTVAIEGFLAVAFWWPRLRWIAAGLGLAFHAGLAQVVQIYHLDLAAIFLYGAFLLPGLPRGSRARPT